MSASLICFYLGYFLRVRSNHWHQRINSLGVFFNLAAAIFLLLVKYALGGLIAFSIYPAVERWIIDVHRFFAATALLLMLTMAFTGYKKIRKLHVPLHYVFLPLYTLVFLSGLIIFQSYPNEVQP